MSNIVFSICHTTARPEGWQESFRAWIDTAAHPQNVEYVLCVDERWGFLDLPSVGRARLLAGDLGLGPLDKVVWNTGRKCLVDGANIACANASGKILIVNSDDMFPEKYWDRKILEVLRDHEMSLHSDFVIRVHPGDKYQAWLDAFPAKGGDPLIGRLMVLQIFSRSRYQNFGYALYPEFTAMMSDTDFTAQAEHDGVVIEARHITIEHRHPFVSPGTVQDDVSKYQNEMASHVLGSRIFERRQAERAASLEIHGVEDAMKIEGWMTRDELTWLAQHAARVSSVLEIGCWKGRSTRALLANCAGPVYALDHWLGSVDGSTTIARAQAESLYELFLSNVAGFSNLNVVRGDAAEFQPDPDFRADMIFIDGSHDYESVTRDIRKFRKLTKRLICGHDGDWDSVSRAIFEEFGNIIQRGPGSIWFVWLDGTQEPSSHVSRIRDKVALLHPGSSFDWRVHSSDITIAVNLASRFELLIVGRSCSNQYIVRDLCMMDLRKAETESGRRFKYVLWRDSDNVLTPEGFSLLLDALENVPEIAAIGGWYLIDMNPTMVCAADLEESRLAPDGQYVIGKERWITFREIQDAANSLKLIECTAQIGFGALLMRREVLDNTGDWPFSPIVDPQSGAYMGDDVSFCRRAIARGFKFWLHPEVYLPHIKPNELPGPRLKITRGQVQEIQERTEDVPVLANAAD